MEKQRYLKMKNQSVKNMLMQALNEFLILQREAGKDISETGNLILRIDDAPKGKLFLNDREYTLLRDAVNELRNKKLAEGKYTDFLDANLVMLMKLKYKRCGKRCAALENQSRGA